MSEITIPSEVANHVLWHENRGGYPAGSFTTKLLDAWSFADDANASRLAAEWPEYAAAFRLMGQSNGKGVGTLESIARGEHDGRVAASGPSVDLSKWAVDLGADGLEPSPHVLNLDGDDKPIVRLHMAFDPEMPERDRQQFGLALTQLMANAL
jgi:hypothetical protein